MQTQQANNPVGGDQAAQQLQTTVGQTLASLQEQLARLTGPQAEIPPQAAPESIEVSLLFLFRSYLVI